MPSDYTPAPLARAPGSDVSTLVDGDAPNRDNLIVETSPGATPKLTLGYLLRVLDGALGGGGYFTKLLVGNAAPDPGSEGVGIEGGLVVTGVSTLATVTASLLTATAARITATFELGDATPPATNAATHTYNVTDGPVLFLDAHTVPLLLTLASPTSASARRYVVNIFWTPSTPGDDLEVRNAGASIIGGLGDRGWLRFRWDGSAWRPFGGCNFEGGTYVQ